VQLVVCATSPGVLAVFFPYLGDLEERGAVHNLLHYYHHGPHLPDYYHHGCHLLDYYHHSCHLLDYYHQGTHLLDYYYQGTHLPDYHHHSTHLPDYYHHGHLTAPVNAIFIILIRTGYLQVNQVYQNCKCRQVVAGTVD
jgi:hypothetical protein